MEKLNRDNFYSVVEGNKHLGGNMMSGEIQQFNLGKAIEELADKVDEIIDELNDK